MAVVSGAAAPQAAADACRWVVHDLPLPSGTTSSETVSSSEGDSLILAAIYQHGYRGAYWVHGDLREMSPPAAPSTRVLPKDINNNALIVGRQDVQEGTDVNARAFRYQDGRYEFLAVEPGEQSEAVAVNDTGDIVGVVWPKAEPNDRTSVVWPADGPRRTLQRGDAIGVSTDRKAVVATRVVFEETAWVIDLVTGQRTEINDAFRPMVLDNDRILHQGDRADGYNTIERTLDGRQVTVYPEGLRAFGKTSSGTLFGTAENSHISLWQWGMRYDMDSETQPQWNYYGDATDGGALIGTYEDWNRVPHAARWFWCA